MAGVAAGHAGGPYPIPSFSSSGDSSPNPILVAQAWQRIAAYLEPQDLSTAHRRAKEREREKEREKETGELARAVEVLKRAGAVEIVFNDFIHQVTQSFAMVEADLSRYLSRLATASALALDAPAQVAKGVEDTLQRIGGWFKLWGSGVRMLDDSELRMLNAVYHSHFQSLLHDYLASTAFPSYLRAYFAHSLSIHRIQQTDAVPQDRLPAVGEAGPSRLPAAPATSGSKASKTGLDAHVQLLVRLGFLPRYADLLVQVACEEIEAIVAGASATAIEAAEGVVPGERRTADPENGSAASHAAGSIESVAGDAEMEEPGAEHGAAEVAGDASGGGDVTMETEAPADEDPGPWGTRRLEGLRLAVRDRVSTWLWNYVDGYEPIFQPKKGIESRLDVKLMNDFFEMRAAELFDMIVDYPRSVPALEDLKYVVQRTGRRMEVVQALKQTLRRRLLHPGAATKSILQVYVNTIRCMRLLDPQGALLYLVADPIRANLRMRSDTVRCIVAALVDNEFDEDEGEIDRIRQIQVRDDEAEDYADPQWEPEPIDAAPEFKYHKSSDIISTLVSIFDSREVVVKEIQAMLAAKLLAVKDYDLEREIRLVELLKLRFGDAALQVCQVMLKDMADSKRTDAHVQAEKPTDLHPLVISRLYWPTVTEVDVKLPKRLRRLQKRYKQEYHKFKPDKQLKFLPHLGTIDVKLELADRAVEVEATPLQAIVMELFQSQNRWDLTEMSDRLDGLDVTYLRHALRFWAGHNVLQFNEDGSYNLLEVASFVARTEAPVPTDLPVAEMPIMQPAMEHIAELAEFDWPEIRALLAECPRTTTQLIHLLQEASGLTYQAEELERFLHAQRRDGLVQMDAQAEHWSMVAMLGAI